MGKDIIFCPPDLFYILTVSFLVVMSENKVIKATRSNKSAQNAKETVRRASDEAMAQLARVMTDAPSIVKLAGIGWNITALKPAVQWEIAKLACDIKREEKASFGDVLRGLSTNLPAIIKIVTLALLNDKKRIEEEYDRVYDTLMWESNPSEWANLLYEVLQLIDVGFFFQITDAVEMFRQLVLQKRTMMDEQLSSYQEQRGVK